MERKIIGYGLGYKSGKNGIATVPYKFPVFEGQNNPQIVEAMEAFKKSKFNK